MSEPPCRKEIDELMEKLGEHYDSVRIFLTAPGGNGITETHTRGSGNFMAQMGQVREWLNKMDEKARITAWDESNEDKEDDDE